MSLTRRVRGLTIAAVAATALVGGSLAAASPASADPSVTGLSSGYVGVPQQIQIAGYANFCVLSVAIQFNNSIITLPPTGQTVVTDGSGSAVVNWTPTSPGSVTGILVNGTTSEGSLCGSPLTQSYSNVTISKVPTTSSVQAPNTTTVGTPTTITVYVQSQSPSTYTPTGSVVVTDANGAKITSMGLTPTAAGSGQSYAYWRFTPNAAGNYFFVATYQGDSNALASPQSPQDVMIATPSGSTISLSAPGTMTQGQPVTLTATVFPAGTQGSVGFTVNGQPISASVPIGANGQASFLWTPNVVGQITLGASYTTNRGGNGSTSEKVTVVAGPVQKDAITLVQPGWGPWNANGTYTLGNGSNFTFQASTLSGAAVTLTETGPCQVSGLTLVVPTGSGQCNIVATSPGGNGYAGVQYGYAVNLIPGNQSATLTAPQSGNVNKGKTLTLESPGQQDTNAGQNITWKITKGKNSVCKLKFPSSGAVTLKLLKRGQCNVKGSAPGVDGQWNPFSVARSYRSI